MSEKSDKRIEVWRKAFDKYPKLSVKVLKSEDNEDDSSMSIEVNGSDWAALYELVTRLGSTNHLGSFSFWFDVEDY